MDRQRLLYGNEETDSAAPLNELSDTTPTIPSAQIETQINLEGRDWLLTTLLITLDAIFLSLYQSDRARWATFLTWFQIYDCEYGWTCELLNTLFIMAVAIVNVCLMIPIITVNVQTPSKKHWRYFVGISWCSLILADIMTIRQFVDSVKTCIKGDDDVDSWTAHFCLVAAAVVTAFLLNVRFFYLYGFMSCFTCSEEETLKKTSGLKPIYDRENGMDDILAQRRFSFQQNAQSQLGVFRAPKLARFDTNKFLEDAAFGFQSFMRRKTQFSRRQGAIRFRHDPASLSSHSFVNRFRRTMLIDKISDTKEYLVKRAQEAYHHVAEVENLFEYSPWMKSAALFTTLMLIYNCIKTTEILFKLASSWDMYHNLALQFQDNLHSVQVTLDDLDGNLTMLDSASSASAAESEYAVKSLNATLPSVISDIQSMQTTLDTFEKSSGKAYDVAGAMLDIALLTTAKLVNITDFKDNSVVGAFFYVDSIIPILKYTCLIGYPVGTFIGLYSLYQVLVQHKRMSLRLEQALTARTPSLNGKVLDDEDARLTLLGIEKKYQIGGAVYFYGILMSTAVVQQHIFGFITTFVLAVIIDIRNFDVLLNIGGYLLFVYLAVLITNLFVTHVIGDRILTKDGFRIQHPWYFFLYLFTFSMVHAVLGFLYALWRALLLLVTTFWVLNRLDVSLFLAGKQLDNGHYSFMSMLLLTRVIRLSNISQGYIPQPNTIEDGGGPIASASKQVSKTPKKAPNAEKAIAFDIPDDEDDDSDTNKVNETERKIEQQGSTSEIQEETEE